jgi:hypothetical protein
MQSTLTQQLSEGRDVLLKVNKPGTGQVTGVREILRNDNILPENFSFIEPYSILFKANAERVVAHGGKVALIDFDIPFNKDTIDGLKKTIDVAKEAGLQVIVVVQTPQTGLGIPNSEVTYVSTKQNLFSALDQALESKFSLKDSVSGMLDTLREKAGFGNKDDNKPKLK